MVVDERYQLEGYKPRHLIAFFCRAEGTVNPSHIRIKPQVEYLLDYCDRKDIKTLVYEPEYIDQFYSEDYSGYYTRPFRKYGKLCSRLHLFSRSISDDEFKQLLAKGDKNAPTLSEDLGYCGFIVIKPLPNTIIGRTCLASILPISDTPSIAFFPTLRRVNANLFGLQLSVTSLPFQEQDREVAACATSALWTVLYATAYAYQHRVLSPLQITQLAAEALPFLSRSLPNDGLHMEHMMSVIRVLGLECELIGIDAEHPIPFQSYISAHLRTGIPVVLSFDFGGAVTDASTAKLHAVAVVGYGMREGPATEIDGFKLRATLINQLYVHDDRVGPFAPLEVTSGDVTIVTSWVVRGVRVGAWLSNLTIPINRQVRIPYSLILLAIQQFDDSLRFGIEAGAFNGVKERPEWDVYLIEVNRLREDIRSDSTISEAVRLDVLLTSMPHFLWRAIGYIEGKPEIDLIFDATDLRQAKVLIRSICHTPALYAAAARASKLVPSNKMDLSNERISRLFITIVDHFSSMVAADEKEKTVAS